MTIRGSVVFVNTFQFSELEEVYEAVLPKFEDYSSCENEPYEKYVFKIENKKRG